MVDYGKGRIKVEPEAKIGDRRWCDLLVTILKYRGNTDQRVAIEVENDREFDAEGLLRQIKKDQPYPVIVVIPHDEWKYAYLFQKSMIRVWYWKAKIKWKCDSCNSVFPTTSSITPKFCLNTDCKTPKGKRTGSNFLVYEGADPEDIEFEKADNNPTMTFGEIQKKLRGTIDAWRFG